VWCHAWSFAVQPHRYISDRARCKCLIVFWEQGHCFWAWNKVCPTWSFLLILVTAIGSMPKFELCFLPGRLRWIPLTKERYGNSLSGCGSNTQPSNWEADTFLLNYCSPQLLPPWSLQLGKESVMLHCSEQVLVQDTLQCVGQLSAGMAINSWNSGSTSLHKQYFDIFHVHFQWMSHNGLNILLFSACSCAVYNCVFFWHNCFYKNHWSQAVFINSIK